ncbi:MAG: hypothetical protein RQ743_02145 [Bacteroidales bacterium]|nr:hypothetical protein [Bacteroidales bacterium]
MGKQEEEVPPVDLVPPEMEDLSLHEIRKGYGYLIGLRKPGAGAVRGNEPCPALHGRKINKLA